MQSNPLAAVIETFRYACLGRGAPEPMFLAISALVLMALLVVGLTIFTRVERTFYGHSVKTRSRKPEIRSQDNAKLRLPATRCNCTGKNGPMKCQFEPPSYFFSLD